jgi:hypothetical protein
MRVYAAALAVVGHEEVSQFDLSDILGSSSTAFLSTYTHHPVADGNVPNALSVWRSEVGCDALNLVMQEFWPDIFRKLHKPKQSTSAK